MSNDAQERRQQGRTAAISSTLIVLVVIASVVGGGIWVAIVFAAVGLALGVYFGVRGLRKGRTQT